MKTGIQVSSFRPMLQTPGQVEQAFEKLAQIGCKWVQLQWIAPTVPTEWIARCLQQSGCISVGLQELYETVREKPGYYIELNAATGGYWFCVSRIPQRLRSHAGLNTFVTELRDLQCRLDAVGQRLCFHPVAADFAPVDGLQPVEYLLQSMPELAICADLYHLNKVEADVPGWLRRYAGRVCMAHFKDGIGDRLVPMGQGEVDHRAILPACIECGAEYGFAEQETWQGDPFERLKEGLDWLDGQLKELQND